MIRNCCDWVRGRWRKESPATERYRASPLFGSVEDPVWWDRLMRGFRLLGAGLPAFLLFQLPAELGALLLEFLIPVVLAHVDRHGGHLHDECGYCNGSKSGYRKAVEFGLSGLPASVNAILHLMPCPHSG